MFGQAKHDLNILLGGSQSGTDVHSWGKDGVGLTTGAQFAYGLNYTYNFTNAFGLRLGFTGTELSGDDIDIDRLEPRAYSFTSPLYELGFGLQWNFLNKTGENGEWLQRKFEPYTVTLLALSFTDPDVDFTHTSKPEKNAQDKENLKKTNLQIPLGFGFKYNFSDKMYLGMEFRNVIPITDYLDGISASANPDDNDGYTFLGLTLGMKFGISDKDGDGIADKNDNCPEIPGLAQFNGCPDTDGDGIMDSEDKCPMVAGVAALQGCPDADGDGIADNMDKCPHTAGLKKFNGCPDTDGDGIADNMDKCPKVAGMAKYNGCPPPDADGDGFADDVDNCPNVKGTVNGCPDTDGDGIIDKNDDCPKVAGTVKGCPDKDKDGIADKNDSCPEVAGIPANKGCPPVKKEVKEKIMSIAKAIYFKTGSDRLRASSKRKLNELVKIMNEYPKMKMIIEGHTDNVGDDQKNMVLSEKRANAVKKYLMSKGISEDRLIASGYGETMPVADNSTPQGRKQNRRVELKSTF